MMLRLPHINEVPATPSRKMNLFPMNGTQDPLRTRESIFTETNPPHTEGEQPEEADSLDSELEALYSERIGPPLESVLVQNHILR